MTESKFGAQMTPEEFLKSKGATSFQVFPRKGDHAGYYYFRTNNNVVGYVPQELGNKLTSTGEHGTLFFTEVTTDGYTEPMLMLCEKAEAVFTFSL